MLGIEKVVYTKIKRRKNQERHVVGKLSSLMTSFPYSKTLDSFNIKRKKRKMRKKRYKELKNFKIGCLIEYKPVNDFNYIIPLYGEVGIVTKIIPKIGKNPMRIYVVFSNRPDNILDVIWDGGRGWFNPIDFEIISD